MAITLNGTSGIIGAINSMTAQNSTSGTSIDFTGIPAGVKRVIVMFNGVSLSGTAGFVVQAGAGSVTTTGYTSGGVTPLAGSTNSGGFTSTTGWILNDGSNAAYIFNGTCVLNNLSSNTWVQAGTLTSTNGSRASVSGGNVTLGGAIDRIRITTTNGTDTFDAGSINVQYE